MRDESTQWDRNWSKLLTHAHGEDVLARSEFKSSLLASLKNRMASLHDSDAASSSRTVDDDLQWKTLLSTTYVPCHPDTEFKDTLLTKLRARQAETYRTEITESTTEADTTDTPHEDIALRTILSKSYKPVEPRAEFQTRLLENLKERQRRTADTRSRSRRLAFYLSSVSGVVAAALVIFVVWLAPTGQAMPEQRGDLRLAIPAVASAIDEYDSRPYQGSVMQASYQEEAAPVEFAGYSVQDVFRGPALPDRVSPLQSIRVNDGDGWYEVDAGSSLAVRPGVQFQANESGMGHLEFPDGSIMTMSPNSMLAATKDGLSVLQGFLLVSVPLASDKRFRMHFPERDIAIEPGTDLAVMVEPADRYAEGGAPAPMVMVVDRQDSPGGLALARGKNGVGPLLAKQLYRLDNYVTADLPSRMLCDTECQDLDKLFKMETVRTAYPKASFAGGFAGDRDAGGNTAIMLTPAGFSKRGDQWVADSWHGQETVKIRYLSDSYFGFANARRDLSRALSLGSNVIIDSGDGTFYEVYK